MSTILLRYSYPKVPGDSPWCVYDATGPTSYTAVTPGTPPTGGQAVAASDFGLEELDWVGAMASDNGEYVATVIPVPFNAGAAFTSAMLMWSVATTGAEVAAATDLSARTVRLLAIGR